MAFSVLTAFALSLLESKALAGQPAAPCAERCLSFQIYIRSDSAVCQAAQKYAEAFGKQREGICVEVIDTVKGKEGLNRYWQLVRRFHVEKPGLPLFYACGRLKTGFSSAESSSAAIEDLFAIHAYIRPTCQHCRDAKRFLTELAKRWKGVRVVFHDVEHERAAIQEMTLLAQRHGVTATAFPVMYVCGRVVSGYQSDATTGHNIEELLVRASVAKVGNEADESSSKKNVETARARCPSAVNWLATISVSYVDEAGLISHTASASPVESRAAATDKTTAPPPNAEPELPPVDQQDESTEKTYIAPAEAPEGMNLPWIGYVRVRDLGMPAFTLLIGLIDGFNPCAMWVLVFLLSVLVNVKDRRKIAAIAGTFVVVSGLAYLSFMAAWLNFFMLVGIARPLQIALGLLAVVIGVVNVKDFFAFKRGVTFSIPESAKPGIYARRKPHRHGQISLISNWAVHHIGCACQHCGTNVHSRSAGHLHADSHISTLFRLEKLCLSRTVQCGLYVRRQRHGHRVFNHAFTS